MCSYALTVDSLWILQSHVLSFLFSPGFWLPVFSLIDAPPVCISSKITSSLKTLFIQIPVLLFRRLYHLLVSDVLSSVCMCVGTDCTLFVFVPLYYTITPDQLCHITLSSAILLD